MTAPSLNTLLAIFLLVSPAFTRPSFRRFLTLFAGWVRTSRLREVLRHLPPGVVFVGAMRGDSTLQRPRSRKYRSPATGRLLTKDIFLPKPAKLARDKKVPWLSMTLTSYGELKLVQYKELVARWYRSAGKHGSTGLCRWCRGLQEEV